MTDLRLENRILSLVERRYGVRGQELTLQIMAEDLETNQDSILDAVFDMIERGQLIEIECVFPNHISKSFIVPKGTLINIVRRR